MNFAHLHLVMNHVPTIGSVAALGVLFLGYVRRNEHLKHVGLEVLFIVALLTLPVYVSGTAGYFEIRDRPGVSVDTMKLHQDVALFGFIWMMIAGFVAWMALWTWRRHGQPGRGLVPAATLLLIMALIVMGRAANLGGEIRHPEILAGAAAAPAGDPNRFFQSAVSHVAVYSTWAWPAAETIHFLGLSLSLGVLLAINLRLLGFLRKVPFADVHRLLPWGMLGFGANLITGMFFFVGQPQQYTSSNPFYWKVAFLVIAGANFLYLTVFGKAWNHDGSGAAGRGDARGDTVRFEPNLADKAMAVLSLTAWLGVLYAGRMLPFLGKSF